MQNCKRKSCRNKIKTDKVGWFWAVVIAILPKCPFCIMAYTGAISLCSGNKLYPNSGHWSSYLGLFFSIIILLSIAYNYKGKKTIYALLLAGIGTIGIAVSQTIWISPECYYISVGLLFFGIWMNGSLIHFYNMATQTVKTKLLTIHKNISL